MKNFKWFREPRSPGALARRLLFFNKMGRVPLSREGLVADPLTDGEGPRTGLLSHRLFANRRRHDKKGRIGFGYHTDKRWPSDRENQIASAFIEERARLRISKVLTPFRSQRILIKRADTCSYCRARDINSQARVKAES